MVSQLVGQLGIDVLLAVGPRSKEYMVPAAQAAGCADTAVFGDHHAALVGLQLAGEDLKKGGFTCATPQTLRRYGELSAKFEGIGGYDTDTAVDKVAGGSPVRILKRVDLPAPLRPRRPTRSPVYTVEDVLHTAFARHQKLAEEMEKLAAAMEAGDGGQPRDGACRRPPGAA